jgi:hypothetical protein
MTMMFKPYFSEWLVRQYFRGWWILAVGIIAAVSRS